MESSTVLRLFALHGPKDMVSDEAALFRFDEEVSLMFGMDLILNITYNAVSGTRNTVHDNLIKGRLKILEH